MRLPKRMGALLVAIWLIVWGILALFPDLIGRSNLILGILAIVAGVFLLMER